MPLLSHPDPKNVRVAGYNLTFEAKDLNRAQFFGVYFQHDVPILWLV